MAFNELNSVEHYIIHQLSGVNLNTGTSDESLESYKWLYKSSNEINREVKEVMIESEVKETLIEEVKAVEELKEVLPEVETIEEVVPEILEPEVTPTEEAPTEEILQ